MKKLIVLASCVALAACSKGEAPAEPDAEVTAEAPTAEDSMAGTYESTMADGSKATTVITEDGKYTNTAADGTVTTGEVSQAANGQTCFNSSEEGSAPECWTDGEPAEDGSWVATNDDGVSVTVRKMEADAAAE
ncbi:hypothetical protein QWY75_03660 [Pontixanthobacter aestiaquae]|uniref:Lipoprotein n=1 Tax=Pontixanthobacter aestiaquae TaxID=1509367 RepID=A0A844Z706_9SPHN|nr:hypothetical protein [Pontixanthobacter aestiaquae]MDN3645303.1 hypothetical protein [Pontixanthobacter aestiaquae]MXO83695.1 hypothetical protein [Pontixanthobacter aestiaquae]